MPVLTAVLQHLNGTLEVISAWNPGPLQLALRWPISHHAQCIFYTRPSTSWKKAQGREGSGL